MNGDPGIPHPAPQAGFTIRNLVVALVVIGVVIAGLWIWVQQTEPVGRSVTSTPPPKPPAVETEPLIRHPVPAPRTVPEQNGEQADPVLAGVLPDPLPALDHSDKALLAITERLIESPSLVELVVPSSVIRRFVATVDALGMRTVPPQHLPVVPPPGKFQTAKLANRLVIDPRNYARYRRHVAFVARLDDRTAVDAYIYLYPLFQQAYEELGYRQRSFNDRLIEVIDQILATPEVPQPVPLEHPSVFYIYADSNIEALSAGQRLLIRVGPENAETVKNKLRAIKEELAR